MSYSSLDPGTTYDFTITASNDEGDGTEAEFTGTTTDSRPRSANFTKYFRDGENAAFARSDFPFSSDESDDVLANVKFTSRVDRRGGNSVVTLEGDFKLKQSNGSLGPSVAPDQLISVSDMDNLVFVPKANFDGTVPVRFKVIDQEDEESGDAYTLTLRQVANIPPSFGAGPLSREIPENSASGTAVGDPVTATEEDAGDTLTYSLSGTDASSFSIDSGTGQISVASGTVLDYEATKNTLRGAGERKRWQGRRRNRRHCGGRVHNGEHRGDQCGRRGAAERRFHRLGGQSHHDEGDRDASRHHRNLANRAVRGEPRGGTLSQPPL